MLRMVLALIGASLLATQAYAQAPSAQLKTRIDEVVTVLRGDGDPAAVFASAFLQAVPPAQFRTIAQSLIAQNRALVGIKSIAATSPWEATIEIDYGAAVVTMRIVIDPAPPHATTVLPSS